MLDSGNEIIGFVLNSIRLAADLFTFVISIIISIIIIYHLCHTRMRQDEKITITLFANIYVLIVIFMLTTASIHIQILRGDIYKQNFNSSWCRFMGYLPIVLFCTLYHVFVDQAFYRLCRIVYSPCRWLQFSSLYMILPYIQLALAFVLFSPLLVWRAMTYIPREHYCYVKFSNLRGSLWIGLIAYGIPVVLLMLIYIRIIKFIRTQPNNQLLAAGHRQQRDLLVIRRIFINVGILFMAGVPAIALLMMKIITGKEHPLSIRIAYTSVDLCIAALTVSLVASIPQLQNIVWKRNHVMPVTRPLAGAIQLRNIPRNQKFI